MKKLILTIIASTFAIASALSAISMTVGTGSDEAYLFIEGFDDILEYTIKFDYDAGSPLDGYDLWQVVLSGDSLLSADISNFGTVDEPNYFLNAVTYNGITLTSTPYPTVGPFWVQWASGGESGYPVAEPIAFGAWEFGSGMSLPSRVIIPFAADAYVFSEGNVPSSMAPIPEPASFLFILGSLLLFAKRRR